MSTRLTIIGGGPGGYVAAIRAAQRGAQVTVIEQAELGGTCLNWGCIPTKTLIASAVALERVRGAAAYGIEVSGDVKVNLAKIRERKDRVVSTQVKGIQALFKSWGVTLIEGRGLLLSPGVVRAVQKDGTTQDLATDKVIIATGSRPAQLPGIVVDGEHVLTSDDAVQLKRVPESVLIIGAGVIGAEFAFIYRAFGAEVTLVEMLPRALATEDEELSTIIEREMKKAKINLVPNTKIDVLLKMDDGTIAATLSNGQEIRATQVLVSIGRSMNSEGIGLEDLGISKGKRGEIIVNERMETNLPGVFAVGDVTGKMMLAHVASRQGIVAVDNALGGSASMDYGVVPAGIFTMPEVGSVGLREKQAIDRGIQAKVGRFQYRGLGKAHAMGEIIGMVKIVANEATDKVLGVHICGAHATDLIHEGALAIQMGCTSAQLGGMIHAHPTLAEALMEAAEDVHSLAIHLPRRTD